MNLIDNVPVLIIIGAIVIPIVVYLALGLGERILALLPKRPGRGLRPWVWLFGPLLLVILILLYPLIATIIYSFFNANTTAAVGFQNFVWAFQGEMLSVIGNNIVWLIVFPIGTLVLALVAAVLFDRIRYERLAMTLIILPTAISFTAGSVIWTQMYSYQPPGSTQIGTFNALMTLIPGVQPVAWLQTPVINNLALILIAVWLSVGVATLILSAGVKNVAGELMEAARLDGAGEWRIFVSIVLPSILPAVLVVVTTEIIAALKVFDIVYVMTNGNYGTNVIANQMYTELFSANNLGRASAIAVILLVAALPIVFINIHQFRAESRS
ncbi:MAG: carbohydrate ABC transporter permease [Humibacter sp.]